ncbi:MAG: DUF1778 domain-containing protein [Candidatus Sabulitectum sp.]|nr:DUF1778 domain-containing protein [Candidatus Sabulitectum sp.]
MATARLDIRLDDGVKRKAERAAALLGMRSLTEYIVKLMDEDSSKVISEYEELTLGNDSFDKFMEVCEAASEPVEYLRKAALTAKKSGIQ